MDFITGQKEAEESSYDEPPPRNIFERFWQWIVSSIVFKLPAVKFLTKHPRHKIFGLFFSLSFTDVLFLVMFHRILTNIKRSPAPFFVQLN